MFYAYISAYHVQYIFGFNLVLRKKGENLHKIVKVNLLGY